VRPSALDSEGGRGSCAPSASLVFFGNSTPDGAGDAIEFHVSPGEGIRLLRANGFEIED